MSNLAVGDRRVFFALAQEMFLQGLAKSAGYGPIWPIGLRGAIQKTSKAKYIGSN